MTAISEFLNKSVNYLLTIGFSDLLDILIVATLIYHAIGLIRKTNSSRVARGIIMILVALWLSGPGLLNLTMFNMFLRKTVELGLIAIVIIFQPELRRVLERVGSSKITDVFLAETAPLSMDSAITQTVLACSDMSKTRTGALIIFERNNRLNDPMSTGTIIGAETTAELLRNIFYPKAPLHDGVKI